ncbi:DUF885 domain-containing protein [Kribbella deserti]|uniref:DUF885 family protein n=1 Tax=Kribbella deserti TaxID=1926257 RepID=A0ABV6QSC0_9ACTN
MHAPGNNPHAEGNDADAPGNNQYAEGNEVARRVTGLMDAAWERALERDPVTANRLGRTVEHLPVGSPEEIASAVAQARKALADLSEVDLATADRETRIAAGFLQDHLEQEVAEEDRHWYRFGVTPYYSMQLGFYRSDLPHLAGNYVQVVEQLARNLDEQRARGIRIPSWACGIVIDTMRSYAAATPEIKAFDKILDGLQQDADSNNSDVGIGQYDGGAAAYEGLIRLHTGLDLTAEEVHRIGLAEVERLTGQIAQELQLTDEEAYRRQLANDPASYAKDSADLERRYQAHLDRLSGVLDEVFEKLPEAPFAIRQLDDGLAGGLTYGYYEPPGADGVGYYHYNGSDLANRPLIQAASVMFHEGLPGHHLQLGRQLENKALHPLRREQLELPTFAIAGYHEGWAEYAAGLCKELGLYPDPIDHYGRLSAERFHAARLVVDTGLNVLGWSREQAGDYLARAGFLSPVEVESEILRYAVDDPGQALAYHLGHWHLKQLRAGAGGDLKQFHEAILADGPLPLRLLSV